MMINQEQEPSYCREKASVQLFVLQHYNVTVIFVGYNLEHGHE